MRTIYSIIMAAALSMHCARGTAASAPVILTEQGVRNLGIETVAVGESDFEQTIFALGQAEAIPEKRSVLSSRVPGRVIENRLRLGTRVTKGDKLVLLESRQPGDPPPSIWLTAPADGTVISVNADLGSPVEPSDSLAEIAGLDTIYLIVTVPQDAAGKIGEGTIARVRFPVLPDKEFIATRVRLSTCPCPDPACALGRNVATRSEAGKGADINTAGVIFTIDNPELRLRPGMVAECSVVMRRSEGVVSVPREAVQGGPADRHVYVKHMTIPNAFDRVNVQTGLTGNDRVEILDGLFPGDEVVTRGSYSLGFAGSGAGPSLKEAMDAAHGHQHNEDGSEMTGAQGDSHADEDHAAPGGITAREKMLIASTGILAVLLAWALLRRKSSGGATDER